MNTITLLGNIPTAVWIGLIASVIIPYISALLTAHPSHLTGWITVILASLDGLLATLAANGNITWKAAGAALISWVIAAITHSKILAGTSVEADLHRHGAQLGREQ